MSQPDAPQSREASAPSPASPGNALARTWSRLKKKLIPALAFLLFMLLALFLIVMLFENPESVLRLFGLSGEMPDGTSGKYNLLRFLGVAMGGVILAIQAANSHRRARALEETAKAQADATERQAEANRNAERGLRQERLKNAIEHLGNESVSVRLGGAYELFHLAEDTKELRQTALDILCAHVRRTTGEKGYRKAHERKPSEEIQSLLTLLFVQKHEVFKGLRANLQGSWLNRADLKEARLQGAVLNSAHLQGALLEYAHLQGAYLLSARLQGANLWGAHLQGARLWWAHLQGARLWWAHLQGARLSEAKLQGAVLADAHLQGADIEDAHLQGADIEDAHFQGADIIGAQLQGVISGILGAGGEFAERIRARIGEKSDLSGVVFAGGLDEKDMNALVAGLSDGEAKRLRERLEPHIDKPASRELPEDSGAETGTYTAEQAEEWIAEYEAAMAEVPKKDAD